MAVFLTGDGSTGTSAAFVWVDWTSNTTSDFADFTWHNNSFQAWSNGTPAVNVWTDWNVAEYVVPDVQFREDPDAVERRVNERAAADEKAMALLRENLTRRQRRELDRRGYFHVHTRHGERVYRLSRGGVHRIRGEDGQRYSFCIHPADGLWPAGDTTLAIKLLLEADEEQFLAIANASRY